METEAMEEILICSIIAFSYIVYESLNNRRRKRKCWVKDFFKERDRYGTYKLNFQEFRLNDSYSFRQYLRMNIFSLSISLLLPPTCCNLCVRFL